ncbi:MAG: hypothetical protein JRJ87_21725 [Deltaproteobacteria bacterium]|nr:hypothetical protein [Deltaproteobacteria bacterium]
MLKKYSYLIILVFVCVVSLAWISGCGGGDSNCGGDNDGVPTIIDDDEDLNTYWVARLGVSELNQLTGPEPGHSSLVQAFFSDFTDFMVQLADRDYYTNSCFAYTSRQVTSGTIETLGVNMVTFEGLVGGQLDLMASGDPPKIDPRLYPGSAFLEDSITISVASSDGLTDFPSFTELIAAPEMPVVTQLGDKINPDMGSGPSIGISIDRIEPLVVKWEAGAGDYIDVKIIPGSGSDTKHLKVRCVTYDDGCLEIPAAAIQYLVPDLATNFQFKIERHNFVLHSIKDGDATKAAALIDVSSILEGTVLR